MKSLDLAARSLKLVLFYGLARHLPDSTAPGGRLWRRLRYLVCRGLFRSCGQDVNIERGAYIGSARTISVGAYSGIGIDSYVGRGTQIGSYVMMGPEVMIFTTNHRASSTERPMMCQGYEPTEPVIICDDVWIGARAIFLPGVRVGKGSIVGAGAVVAKDVPEGVIVVGNPARVVRARTELARTPTGMANGA